MHFISLSDVFSLVPNWLQTGWLPTPAACLPWSQPLALAAVTAVWQGALIAAGLALCLRFAPATSAAQRFLLWSAGFAVLIALSVWPFLQHRPGGSAPLVAVAPPTATGPLLQPIFQIDLRWSLLIAALWLSLTAWRAIDLLLHLFQLRRLYTSATPVRLDESVAASLCSAGLLSRRPVSVCITESLQRPSVIGFFVPRILIPGWLYPKLTAQELEQILRHEAEHLHRGDDWTNLLQKIGLLLFPLNPALLWIERRLCQEREMACDDSVVAATQAPRAYAECLARLAEYALRYRGEALSLGFLQRRPELVRRVQSLLLRKGPASPLTAFVTFTVLACGLLFASFELAHLPQLIAFVPPARPALQIPQQASVPANLQPAALVLSPHAARPNAAKLLSTRAFAAPTSTAPDSISARSSQPQPQDDSYESQVADVLVPEFTERPVLVLSTLVISNSDQLSLPASSAHIVSDFEFAPDSAPEWPAQLSRSASGRVSITRLIVRILPPANLSSHPAAGANRGSWLVIQL